MNAATYLKQCFVPAETLIIIQSNECCLTQINVYSFKMFLVMRVSEGNKTILI